MVRAEIDGVQCVRAELALHLVVDFMKRLQIHQAAADAALVGDQREKKAVFSQPAELRGNLWHEFKHLPRDNEFARAWEDVDHAVTGQKQARATQGYSTIETGPEIAEASRPMVQPSWPGLAGLPDRHLLPHLNTLHAQPAQSGVTSRRWCR